MDWRRAIILCHILLTFNEITESSQGKNHIFIAAMFTLFVLIAAEGGRIHGSRKKLIGRNIRPDPCYMFDW